MKKSKPRASNPLSEKRELQSSNSVSNLPVGRAMKHKVADFLFDGTALAMEGILDGSSEEKYYPPDLQPLRMFPSKNDILSSAILLQESVSLNQLSEEDLSRTEKRWQSQILTSEAQTDTAYYRWQNIDTSSTLVTAAKPPKYVLVEESRLEEMVRFESTLKREQAIIASSTNGQFTTKSIFEHNSLDPRHPTEDIKLAMNSLSENRLKFLSTEWSKLHERWSKHVAHFGYNAPNVFREFAYMTHAAMTREINNSADSWLLKHCPPYMQERKIKGAKAAAKSHRGRKDRDTMLYEDDRSFLIQQIFEAKARSDDYKRYCDLAKIFGPMPPAEWSKAKSRPGLLYYIRATTNAIKIQRVWDIYWSTYKLRRYRAARRVQTKFRAWYGYKSLHPLIILRMKFGKRTYYFWCWAQWVRYNYLVKAIRTRLEHMRTFWRDLCWVNWKSYVSAKIAKKQSILSKFRLRFDSRMGCFHRMVLYRNKSKRIKCWLRRTWNVPQLTLWIEYVAQSKRLKALNKVIVPVQAYLRMIQKRKFYLKMKKSRPFLLKFVLLLYCRAQVTRQREAQVQEKFITWGPEELARRASSKVENERRRLLRERQVAEEKATTALTELKRHLRSGNGKTQLRQHIHEHRAKHSFAISKRKAQEHSESEIFSRCFACNLDLHIHEYRTTKPPHIVCADPTCKLTFSSDELYIQHMIEMCDESDDVPLQQKESRRGSAILAKAISIKKAQEKALVAATDGRKGKKKVNNMAKKHASVGTIESASSNIREHAAVDYAKFHIILKSESYRDALRNYLSRKYGIGKLVNTLDCWHEINAWKKTSISSDSFVKRALVIFENFIRPGGARPITIDPDNGDMRDDLDEDDGSPHWMLALINKCEAIKTREYEGFYQAAHSRNILHRLFGMKGKKYQQWTDAKMLTSDIFDGLEYACLLSLLRMVWDDKAESSEFQKSREFLRAEAAQNEYSEKLQLALLEDCRVARTFEIKAWCAEFRKEEIAMKDKAYEIAEMVMTAEVERLVKLAMAVGRKETLFKVRHKEQQIHEEKMAMCDDATDWAADTLNEHLFEFYVPRLLNTMLGYEEMVEGMMEYAGLLKNKKLKKHLEMSVTAIGVREDLTWFKELLKTAIADDAKTCPKDYLGSVKLLQRRARGMIARNIARKLFIKVWAKKFDPENERFYYVNQETGDIDWVRPPTFRHLFPKVNW